MRIIVLAFILSVFSSCVKNVSNPSWLKINNWTLNENPNAENIQGEMTHNFTDAWVYAKNVNSSKLELVGVFELPIKIPLQFEGSTEFIIYPTVKNNGISATKKIYPFVEPYRITSNMSSTDTITVNPTTYYANNTKFWIEAFEDADVKIENDPNSQTQITKDNDPSILEYGNFYGVVNLNTSDSVYVGYTNGSLQLPRQGAEVYLEIDYRLTSPLITGVLEVSSSLVKNHINIQLNAQEPTETIVWKKIYIDLKEIISGTPQAQYYEITFESVKPNAQSTGQVVIDNIKLVYR
jgi:hypothetical protein